ncbi:hypothetical protein [Hydrogenophaga atypica]|uniref:Uncharacterized protein n=1 Tax=Hydrogenophaga atypica TaxID=249409 RepID=A0ABW2QQ75_9BURK
MLIPVNMSPHYKGELPGLDELAQQVARFGLCPEYWGLRRDEWVNPSLEHPYIYLHVSDHRRAFPVSQVVTSAFEAGYYWRFWGFFPGDTGPQSPVVQRKPDDLRFCLELHPFPANHGKQQEWVAYRNEAIQFLTRAMSDLSDAMALCRAEATPSG